MHSDNFSPKLQHEPDICLVGASFDNHNLGVGALTTGSIKCILHSWPKAKVWILNYGKTPYTYQLQLSDEVVAIPLVNIRFSKYLFLANSIFLLSCLALLLKLLPFSGFRNWLISKNYTLKRVHDADIVVSIAGGDSFSDIYGLPRLFYVALPQLLALWLDKRLVLLPQTIGPFKGKVAIAVARYILGRAEATYSRDLRGGDYVQELLGKGQNSRTKFCFDVGLLVDPIPPKDLQITGVASDLRDIDCLIGLNVSGLLLITEERPENHFGLRVGYEELVNSLIRTLLRDPAVSVLLIPHVMGDRDESDRLACKRIYDSLGGKYAGRLGIAYGTYNEREIKYIIGRCSYFLGSRMHACIAAISQHVPAISIAYSDKFIGVMESLGIQKLVADPRQESQTEILEKVEKFFQQRAAVHAELAEKIPLAKATVLGLFQRISVSSDKNQTSLVGQDISR